jgi:hypothetical protein
MNILLGLCILNIIKYILLFHHQNAGQNRDVKIANRFSENVSRFKDLSNNSNKSKFDSEGNYEETEFW